MSAAAVATNRLSLAASAIWRHRTAGADPYDTMGRDADCGPLIAAAHRAFDLRVVADAGYASPGEYNADLRSRMVTDHKVTSHVHDLLCMLGIEDVCPRCGAALTVTQHRTRQYGGGWDTFTRCLECGFAEAYV